MKKSFKTYLLIVVVIAVWGILIQQFFNAIHTKPSDMQKVIIAQDFIPKPTVKSKKYAIVASYRDPFLGTLKVEKSSKTKSKNRKKVATVLKKNIIYTGYIGDTSSNQVYFVSIDGQQHVLSISNTVNGVTLISGSKDFIRVAYDKNSDKIMRYE